MSPATSFGICSPAGTSDLPGATQVDCGASGAARSQTPSFRRCVLRSTTCVRRIPSTWTRRCLKAVQLAGYRDGPVYLRGSRHVPPNREGVRAAMSTLFELLAAEESAAVRSVLGHWMMGYIHPFPDGNGRTARFMMNSMLASGGYPWTVVETGARGDYLAALEAASVDGDIKPFASFLAKRVIAAGSGGAAP
ncbi:MAG: Fic family protein [Thermoleophilia bacterium]|nr:Fic family protein [Thermoleophilia bacterium]